MKADLPVTRPWFRWITLIIPILFFLLLEGLLRLLMPEPFKPLVREVTFDNTEYYQVNRDYLKKFFPSHADVVPEFKESVFRRRKLKNTVRIFCLGGSSMFGTPYQMNANIPGILRRQLRHLYPENDIEVVNLGASAINSNVVAELAHEIIRYEPDLVCIYMGHNEFYGPDGVSADIISRHFPSFIHLKYQLRSLRLYQLMRSLITRRAAKSEDVNLMRQVSRGNLIRLHSEESEFVFLNFERNLNRILSLFEKKQIPVILSDVASNLLFQPFVSDSMVNGTSVKVQLNRLNRAYRQGNITRQKTLIEKLWKRDSTNAALNFYKGLLEKEAGNYDRARHYLIRAKDYDLLKFRAPSAINTIIRKTAKNHNVTFISGYHALVNRSQYEIPGFGLFWEHLHPNLAGYFTLAREFLKGARKVDQQKGAWEIRTNELPLQTDSLHIPWVELAYADLAIYHLTGKWPFRNFHYKPWLKMESNPLLQKLVEKLYNRQMVWDEACYRSATIFEQLGRFKEAETTYRAVLEDYPLNFYVWYRLGRLYNLNNLPEKAYVSYKKSVSADSNFVLANLELGLLEINKGMFKEAKRHLKKAVDNWIPKQGKSVKATALYGLGGVYANEGQLDLAKTFLKQAVELQPEYQAARDLLERIRNIRQ